MPSKREYVLEKIYTEIYRRRDNISSIGCKEDPVNQGILKGLEISMEIVEYEIKRIKEESQ